MTTKKVFVLLLIGALVLVSFFSGCINMEEDKNKMLIHVYVKQDQPKSGYAAMEGIPTKVGIYRFYLENPDVPGSGRFEKLDEIPLERKNRQFYGEKLVKKINDTLCIGYPPVNYVDGMACVEIDQSEKEANVTVHYWRTMMGVSGKKEG